MFFMYAAFIGSSVFFVYRFKTIRDINRFFNNFVITYPKIKNNVDIYNYINLIILQVFYIIYAYVISI